LAKFNAAQAFKHLKKLSPLHGFTAAFDLAQKVFTHAYAALAKQLGSDPN